MTSSTDEYDVWTAVYPMLIHPDPHGVNEQTKWLASEVRRMSDTLSDVFCEITGGRLSYPTYDARTIITEVTDTLDQDIRDAVAEVSTELEATEGDWAVAVREARQARDEAARLRAGEAADAGDPYAWPTPGQWLRRFNDHDAEDRLAMAGNAIANSQRASQCFEQDHEGLREQMSALSDNLVAARDEATRLRAERDEAGIRWGEHYNAALAAAQSEAERLRRVIQAVEALFSGGPDTSCRTVWDEGIECVSVPINELRAALAEGTELERPAKDGER